jgi:eukaryotic-like serine/threonine-protein kinase
MPLSVGDKLGRYEIVALLGKGGMGEVYQARDTRLGRDVAIKAAHARFSDRFETEARAIAQVNHRNVCTLYDVGLDYLVMECVVGETLAARLTRGPIGLGETVDVAMQIADGLSAAHARGVLHRDLKPANLMITPAGEVKIMDFGLARLAEIAPLGEAETALMTAPGQVMGTLDYLSPEQIRGEPASWQTDIWAFGATLYEMLVGVRPFRSTPTRSIGRSILEDTPASPSSVRPGLPKAFDAIIRKAIAKEPAERYQSARDLLNDLRRVKAGQEGRRRSWLAVATGFVAIAFLTAAAWFAPRSRPGRENAERARPRLEQITAFPDAAVWPAVSRDGKMLAFIRGPGVSAGQVYVKMLPNGEPVALTHDNNRKLQTQFSPDGSHVVYTVIDQNGSWDTWTVPVLGGAPRLWLPNASGMTWLGGDQRDQLVFSEIKTGMHMAVVAAAENRTGQRDIYDPPTARGMAHLSQVSPDRRWAALAEMDALGWLPCRAVPIDGSTRGTVIGPATGGCTSVGWSPDGQFVYTTSNASGQPQIWRQRFPEGKPQQVTFGPAEAAGITIAPDGSIVTSIGLSQGSIWVHENGEDRQVSGEGDAALPAWGDGFPSSVFSPDGATLYYLVRKGVSRGFASGELWAANTRTGASAAVLPGMAVTSYDISPDGREVVFAAIEAGNVTRIWHARVDQREPPKQIASMQAFGPVFGDGRKVYFRGVTAGQSYIFRSDLTTGATDRFRPVSVVNSPAISPDRNWLIVTTPFEGRGAPEPSKAYPVKGGEPVNLCSQCFVSWSRDASTIYFTVAGEMGSSKSLAVPLRRGQMFPALPPGGFATLKDGQALRGARVIDRPIVYPGTRAGVYAYIVQIAHRNLYRVTVP